MSTVVIGIAASHTTLMNTRWDRVDHLATAHEYRDSLGAAQQLVEASGADVAVIVGPNHFRGFWLDLMPSFTIGIDIVEGAGEHGSPHGRLPTDPTLARSLLAGLLDAGFDPAFSARLQVDHGITHAIQYVLPTGLPIVPVVINCFAPPLPSLARCAALGTAIGAAIASDELDHRVAVIGSGGLSHQLPFPDWRAPTSDDDRFLVQSWLDGRDNWAEFETRRREIVVGAPAILNTQFDARVLAALEGGTMVELVDLGDELGSLAGNGGNEIRNWLIMAAACGHAPGRTLCYSAMPEWLTGMAVAAIEAPVPPAVANAPASTKEHA